ncbi:neprilysin-1-like [Amblyomma americanum]
MNTAVHPCTNFYSFVCGSWKPVGKERSMIERILNRSLYIALEELQGDPQQAPVPMAQRHFQSCMAKRSEDLVKSETEKFRKFKREVGLTWPEEWPEKGGSGVPPLMILINLTVNWNINLLFNLRAMPPFRNRPKSLYLRRGDWQPRWQTRTLEQFTDLVKQHCEYLGVRTPRDGLSELKTHLKAMISQITTFTPDARDEQKQTLKEIDARTTSDKDQWWEYLNEIYRPQLTWSQDDVVLIEHPDILSRLHNMLENTPPAWFRMTVSWVFIRLYLWQAIGKPELRYEGDASTLETIRALNCFTHAESTFGLVVAARHIHERFSKTLRDTVNYYFKALQDEMKYEFANASWIDQVVKKKSLAKLESIWKDVFPDNRFFSSYSLAALYKTFPDAGDSFMDNIVNGTKARRKFLASENFVSIYDKRLGRGSVASRYSYYYNSVSLSIGALEPPLLYDDGTLAMAYGSMATTMAASMVRSFDERGIRYDEKGTEDNWWNAGRDEYNKRTRCDLGIASSPQPPSNVSASSTPSSPYVSPLFSRQLAVHAAFQAYRKAVDKLEKFDVMALDGLETYTDDQVFFMTYCLMTCAVDRNGDECNVPLRHSSKFASTFRCSSKDAMNPKKKCTFFE